ncbi:MAG: ABC transporter permease [Nitratireductor sp.]
MSTEANITSAAMQNSQKPASGIWLALRFALRELRGGLKGFYIFLACIALGVAAISGVNSVSQSITQGIAAEGQNILGGDVSVSLSQRGLSPEQLSYLDSLGVVSTSANLRGMARLPDGSNQALIELKAVDLKYPLFGELVGQNGVVSLESLGADKIVIEQILAERLEVAIGDTLRIGLTNFTIKDFIKTEPDKLGEGFGFGPRVLMSEAALKSAELLKPGSIVRNTWKLKLNDASEAGVALFEEDLKAKFPNEGWRIRSRGNAAPALSRNIERFSDFLTLVGLTALIVGGVGVANAIRAFLETKRPVIATFKSLGAAGNLVFQTYLLQILILSLGGIFVGLLIGAAMPFIAISALQGVLPLPQSYSLQWAPLALGAVYGLLTAFAFAIWPLGVAREIPATDLFRSAGGGALGALPRLSYLIALVICVAILVAMAIFLSANKIVAAVFVGAIAFAFVLLRIVSMLIQKAAKAAPKAKSTELRMAVANIHRKGSLTPSVVLSLGLGLALLVSLALIDGNLRKQVSGNIPERAPDFFFVDIQNNEQEGFENLLSELSPEGKVFSVPMLRGRVVSIKGIKADEYDVKDGGEWVLRGDRGITYSKNLPENSTLSKGEWWDADYTGEPLVSFAAEEAGELNLTVGDKITVNVLGRNITAKIASLRNVEWESLAINFVMVFSPNTFAGAPHSFLSTLTTPDAVAGEDLAKRDGDLIRNVSAKYPGVTSVRVREALDTVNDLIGQLALAIRAAASVALIASVLVLGGALAAGNNARVHDAVVLKTLGATRGTLIRSFIYEYALLGVSTAIFALLAGGVAAWFVITQIMQFPYEFLLDVAAGTVLAALVLTVGFGLVGTWRVLGQKAAPVLREL